jgi:multidrug efflux pump subunit AcrA (membrane-fusion protein)
MMKCGILTLLISSSFLATACGSGNATAPAPEHVAQSNKDEIVLPPNEQAASLIQTQGATLSQEPDLLRVTGRIALADDRTWRVGVLTEGRVEVVYAGLGDYVKKGQVLARMHSHELHEARAQYETSQSELNRLQAAASLAQRNYEQRKKCRHCQELSRNVYQSHAVAIVSRIQSSYGEIQLLGRNGTSLGVTRLPGIVQLMDIGERRDLDSEGGENI